MLTLEFDGLYRGFCEDGVPAERAGVMCYGWLIYRDGRLIARGHGGFARCEDASSNIAEYLALIEGLSALVDMGLERDLILIKGDARSVIDQMQGLAAVNSPSTRPLYRRASRLASKLKRAEWRWMPRRKNHDADLLTRRAMKQIRANPQRYQAAIRKGDPASLPHNKRKQLFSLLDLRIFQPLGLTL